METASTITPDDISELWKWLAARTADPRAGIFGPSSVSWKVNRESALFLGAGRAALLQLAHPWVAAALDQHSNLRNDPLARFHNTFRVIFTMVFGTLNQALSASQSLYQMHSRITGRLPAAVAAHARGSVYQANEINALRWVHATLVESALLAYEVVSPPLSPAEREAYYAESKLMAALFGIPPSALPADWAAFAAYNRAMWDSETLGVNALSRGLAHHVLHGRGSWVPVPGWYRAITAVWLPERLREQFELSAGQREAAAAARARQWLPVFYRRLPDAARFVGPYHEAVARLMARNVGPVVRWSNRFWMGQSRMMFSE
ncbi:MAG: DUF2236 domain-containing protein [Acidobacteria bacterium]|nr:DUF2236 domain-containing protein [Acidobacteriota bacterium]MBW4045355.1 DUF2236 domain-containing protein [Acidobacteriota bacterium]